MGTRGPVVEDEPADSPEDASDQQCVRPYQITRAAQRAFTGED